MELRDYQVIASENVRRKLKNKKRIILCAPTGAGKTRICVDFIIRAIQKGLRVCVLCDREELVNQVTKAVIGLNINIQFIKKGVSVIYPSNLYIGMVETFYRRASQKLIPTNIDLFILDEAHTGNYFKIFDLYPNSMYIGPTATPVSSSKNHPLNKYWEDIVLVSTTPELIEKGYLVPSIEFSHQHLLNLSIQNGEFTSVSQRSAFDQHNLDKFIVEQWLARASDRQTIVFCIDVAHSEKLCQMFKDADVLSDHVDANSKDRYNIIGKYKAGFTQVLCNVNITTKGFDDPATQCVVAACSTSSLSRWYQMIGRGGRIYKDKYNFMLFDMGNNILRHGSFNDEMDWKSVFDNDSRDKNFKVSHSIWFCPTCYNVVKNIYTPKCDICGTNFKENKLLSPEDAMPSHLRKDTSQMTFKELQEYGKIKGYKGNWAFMQAFGKKRY